MSALAVSTTFGHVDRVGEGQVLLMPRHRGQDLFGLALEQDHVFEPEHRAEMRRPRVVLALGDDFDDLCSRRAEITFTIAAPNSITMISACAKSKRLFVEREFLRLDRRRSRAA